MTTSNYTLIGFAILYHSNDVAQDTLTLLKENKIFNISCYTFQ